MTVLLAFALLAAAPSAARGATADTSLVPAPVGFVNDRAGLMDEDGRAKLESFLDQVRTKTGAQFAVLTLPTTAPLDPASYKTAAYQAWFHGNRTSLLLLVAKEERRIEFETGYELEGILPDALESRIIREEMTPRFRQGDYAGGITAAVLRVASLIAKDRGVALEWNGTELRYEGGRGGQKGIPPVFLAFVVLSILFSFISGFGRRRRFRGGGGWWGPWLGGGFGGGGFGGGGGGGGFGGFGGGGGFGSGGGGGGGGW